MVGTRQRAGSAEDLRKEGQLLTKVGTLPVVVFWHDGRGLRDRGPLPAPRLPAAPGHGRVGPRHLPLAPRALRSRVGLHARPVGRRRQGLRRRDRRRRRVRHRPRPKPTRSATAAPAARRARGDISLVDREVGARAARRRRRAGRDRAHRRRVRHDATARPGWGAGLTVLIAMANLLPHLDPTSRAARARARPRRSSRTTPRGQPPRFPVGAARRPTTCPSIGSRSGTGASSTRASSDAAERVLETALAERQRPRTTSRR